MPPVAIGDMMLRLTARVWINLPEKLKLGMNFRRDEKAYRAQAGHDDVDRRWPDDLRYGEPDIAREQARPWVIYNETETDAT